MQKNPTWYKGNRFVPQYSEQAGPVNHGKIYVAQTFLQNDTASKLLAAGVTHVWENNRQSLPGASAIKKAYNFSTGIFGTSTPTREQVRAAVDAHFVPSADVVITDEFAEGDFGQSNPFQTSYWFYERVNEICQAAGITARNFGEYASVDADPIDIDFKIGGAARDPFNSLYENLLGPNTKDYISGNLAAYYNSNNYLLRGKCIDFYYNSARSVGDFILGKMIGVQVNYNAGPNEELIYFPWPKMQTTSGTYDGPERNFGAKRPNGETVISDQICPAELLKFCGLMSMATTEGSYMWGDNGIQANSEQTGPAFLGAGIDGFNVGVRWFSAINSNYLAAGRSVLCADYTSNGSAFTYTGERELARKGAARPNNFYLLNCVKQKRGFSLVIPGTTPSFIYFNPYLNPAQSEAVTVSFEGSNYNLGTIPGCTLYVS